MPVGLSRKGDIMKHRKNEPPKIPPDKKLEYQFLHTAISKGIAVFFLFDTVLPIQPIQTNYMAVLYKMAHPL